MTPVMTPAMSPAMTSVMTPVMTPAMTPAMTPVMTPVAVPVLQSPPLLRPPAPPQPAGNVPPLTELQKKIVAEFKCKMANLPPQEQAAYIAQNKINLIKQLNFQPNQLRILQTSQPPAPVLPSVRPPSIARPPDLTRPNMIQLGMSSIQQRLPAPVITGLDIHRPPLTTVQPFDK